MIDIDLLKAKDATHKLNCRHAQNRRQWRDYFMDCIVLKEMSNNKLKILVFGERYWPGNDNKKQIRYVDKYRVKPNSDFNKG